MTALDDTGDRLCVSEPYLRHSPYTRLGRPMRNAANRTFIGSFLLAVTTPRKG